MLLLAAGWVISVYNHTGEEKIAANSYNKNVQENIHFENRTIGNIAINNQRYFVISYREPDKSALNPELRYIVMKLWFYDSVLKTFNQHRE